MSPRLALVFVLFFVSGATGLLYEVAFSKKLATIFGATAWAVSTVLAAFMAGLALGAHLGGRFASRVSRPLSAYGLAEIAVGLVCATTPLAFDAIEQGYVALARDRQGSLAALTALRASLTFVTILVPTACMGATLPLLSRLVTGDAEGPRLLPRLYAANTVGGALGSLAGAYAVLPAFGVRGTLHAAALANVTLGAVALWQGGRWAASAPARSSRDESSNDASLAPSMLFFAAGSGLAVFAAEVVETHLLTLLIGNSAYAFGLMLAVFLVCLGIGAARAPAFAARHGQAALGLGLGLAALSLALSLPLWDQLPRFFAAAGKLVHSWGGRELCRAAAALGILAVPTLFMGTTFPLLLAHVAERSGAARAVAKLTVANTLGTIAGSLLTGYVVLPRLGSQGSLVAVTMLFAMMSLFALLGARREGALRARSGRAALAFAALGMLAALLSPHWDLARMTNGAHVYFAHGPPPDAIELVREDVHGGVTTVARRGALRTLYTNGKFQGDDGPEMQAQRAFAHYPALFLEREQRALVIGLGTGVTLGAVAAYPFERIDVAEISPSIVEAARLYYAGPSLGALDDPRTRLLLDDGRSVLLVGDEPYDLVTIELTSVWFAGASALYSEEFYRLVKRRLAPGGVLQQWVQLHHLRPRELGVVVRTLRRAFEHVALFEGGAQGILVASATPLVASRARLERLDALPAVQETTERPLVEHLGALIASDAELDRLVEDLAREHGGPIVSTDDNLFLEYATPKGNVLDYAASLEATRSLLERYRTPDPAARHLGP